MRNSCQQGVPNQLLCDRVLRPFLYFFRLNKETRKNGDLKRFATCIQVLLQSISSSGTAAVTDISLSDPFLSFACFNTCFNLQIFIVITVLGAWDPKKSKTYGFARCTRL